MLWILGIIVMVFIVLFFATWYSIGDCPDVMQLNALTRCVNTLQEDCTKALKRTPPDPLDKELTLMLMPAGDGSEESYFQIKNPDIYAKAYSAMTTGYGEAGCNVATDKPYPAERTITLRELLNRLLEDAPVELVHEVKPDWSFKNEWLAEPSDIGPDVFATAASPVSFGAPMSGTLTSISIRANGVEHNFPLFTDHN